LLGSGIDFYNNFNSTSFNFSSFQSGNLSAFSFSIGSGNILDGWNISGFMSSFNGSPMMGGFNYSSWIAPTTYDGATIPGYSTSISAFANFIPPAQTATGSSPDATATSSGGGWLSKATTTLGVLSMVPLIGDYAGAAEAILDMAQGHWSDAAWAGGTALAATFGLGVLVKAAKYGKYEVGAYKALRAGAESGLEAHHVGQAAVMENLVANYSRDTAPAILVPKLGHTLGENTLARNLNVNNARDLLARDIKELCRVYPDIPNDQLQKLIDLNKQMYPEMAK
jgi:hypothetical protein